MPNERGGEGRGQNIREVEIFAKFIKRGRQNKWGGGFGISKNPLISVINEKRDINV